MIAILLAPVYLLANYYLLRRVMGWVKAWFPFFRTARHWALPVAVQAFLVCSVVIAFFLPEGEFRRAMKLVGNYWLGVLLYVLLAVIAADLLRLLLGHVLPFGHIFVTTKMHRIAGCVCALAIFAASVWGVINARVIHVTPYEVTVNKTVEGMDEMKIVLVADLHLGYNIGEKQTRQMVTKINEQDADLVVIAGDIFDNEWEAVDKPETIAATLRGIRSNYGVYACYGNHDIEEPVLAGFTFRQSEKKESDPRMDEFLKDANITLLRDEGTLIDGKFYLYGRPDAHRPGRGIETRKTPNEITADMDKDFLPPLSLGKSGQLYRLLLKTIGIQHEIKHTHNQHASLVIVRCRCVFGNHDFLESIAGQHQGTLLLFHFRLIRDRVSRLYNNA